MLLPDLHVYVPASDSAADLSYVLVNVFVDVPRIHIHRYHGTEPPPHRCRPALVCVPETSPDTKVDTAEIAVRVPVTLQGVSNVALSADLPALAEQQIVPSSVLRALFRLYATPAVSRDGKAADPFDEGASPAVDVMRGRLFARLGLGSARTSETAFVALTHDVDWIDPYSRGSLGWFAANGPWSGRGIYQSYGGWAAASVKHLGRVVRFARQRSTEMVRWYECERELGVRSSYYFLEDRASRHDPRNGWYSYDDPVYLREQPWPLRSFIARLAVEGFEIGPHIGLHASNNATAYRSSVAGVRSWMPRVGSTRHHWCATNLAITLSVMEEERVHYDLNYGGVGFALATATPFRLYHPVESRASSVIAIPTIVMDDLLFKKHRLGLSVDVARDLCASLLNTVCEHRGIVAIAFHPDAYRHVDKLAFYRSLLQGLCDRGVAVGPAHQAGEYASRRFATVVEHGLAIAAPQGAADRG